MIFFKETTISNCACSILRETFFVRLFVLFLSVIFSYSPSFSEDCGTTSCSTFANLGKKEYRKKLDEVYTIFYGEVVNISRATQPNGELPYQNLKIRVIRIWKGVETNEMDVEYGLYDVTCSVKKGEKKIFYIFHSEKENKFYTGQCANKNYFDQRMKKELGKGKLVENTNYQSQRLFSEFYISSSFWEIICLINSLSTNHDTGDPGA